MGGVSYPLSLIIFSIYLLSLIFSPFYPLSLIFLAYWLILLVNIYWITMSFSLEKWLKKSKDKQELSQANSVEKEASQRDTGPVGSHDSPHVVVGLLICMY